MKIKLIIQENHPELLLFFAGWGTDETPFLHLKSKSMDVAFLYDYTQDRIAGTQPEEEDKMEKGKEMKVGTEKEKVMEVEAEEEKGEREKKEKKQEAERAGGVKQDRKRAEEAEQEKEKTTAVSLQTLTGRYKTVHLAAWSMGVWSAEYFFSRMFPSFNPGRAVAVNGTPYPIHSSLGIPPAVYDGTVENLPAGLNKFHLRMCGQKETYEKYRRCIPQRDPQELKTELLALRERIFAFPAVPQKRHIRWDAALISENDRIFPTENQQAFWNNYFQQKDSCSTDPRRPQQPQSRTYSDIPFLPDSTAGQKTGTGTQNPAAEIPFLGKEKNKNAAVLIPGGHFPFFRWTYWEDLFAAGASAETFVKTYGETFLETSLETSVVPPVK